MIVIHDFYYKDNTVIRSLSGYVRVTSLPVKDVLPLAVKNDEFIMLMEQLFGMFVEADWIHKLEVEFVDQ